MDQLEQKLKFGDIQGDWYILAKHLKMDIYLMVPLIFIHYQKFRNLGCIRASTQFSYLLPCPPVLLLMSLLYSIVPGEDLGQLVLFVEIQ